MKQLFILIAFLCTLLSFGCKKNQETPAVDFNLKKFNLSTDYPFITKDNGFIAVDYLARKFSKFDLNGNLLWEKRNAFNKKADTLYSIEYLNIGFTSSTEYTSLWEIVFDSIKVISGEYKYYYHFELNKFDNNGATFLKKKFSFNLPHYQPTDFGITELSNGDYILSINTLAVNPSLFLFNISSQGTLNWNKSFIGDFGGTSMLYSDKDSIFYSIQSIANNNDSIRIIKYGASGNKLLYKSFSAIFNLIDNGSIIGSNKLKTEDINSIITLDDGSLILTGNIWIQNKRTWFVCKLDNQLDYKKYILGKLAVTDAYIYVGSPCILNNGNLFLVGNTKLSNLNASNRFISAVVNINTFEQETFSYNDELKNYAGLACFRNSDGTISVFGNSIFLESLHTFYFKLNSDGSLFK